LCALVVLLAGAAALRPCRAQEADGLPVIDGTWVMTAVVDNAAYQEELTVTTVPPLLTVRSTSGYCAFGILLAKADGYLLLWRVQSLGEFRWYKGSTRRDPCSLGGTETETMIAGTVALYSRREHARRGTFTAYRRTTLRVAVTPQGSGSVVSDSDAIACGEDCIEQYTGGCRKVTLTALPAAGWTFHSWQVGHDIVAENPLIDLRVTGDLDVLAVFAATDR